jgi:HEAT repeat protein
VPATGSIEHRTRPLRADACWSVYELTHRAPGSTRSAAFRICWQTIFICRKPQRYGKPLKQLGLLSRQVDIRLVAGASSVKSSLMQVRFPGSLLAELLDDADRVVAREAACALGRMGRTEARPALLRLLREAPSAAVIEATGVVADEECLVILGRIARTRPGLADAALAALDSIGSSHAVKIATASRRSLPP